MAKQMQKRSYSEPLSKREEVRERMEGEDEEGRERGN